MLTVRVYDNYNLIAFQDLDTDDIEGCEFSKMFRAETIVENSYAKAVTRIAPLVGFERFSQKRVQTSKTKMKTCSETSKNISRLQVDMVFDIRKSFKIRRKKFVFSAENMLSESGLKLPLIKYA